MKIGIDASRAFLKNRTGIEEYSYQVIKNLTDKLKGHQVVLYIRLGQQSTVNSQQLPENWKIKVIKWPYFWTQIGLSLELLFHPVDVLFVPAHTVPPIHPENTVVTIHGLEYEFCPKAYSFWERFYMRFVIKNSCRWAKKIVAVSENTKKDLMTLYEVPEGKIEVVYEGCNAPSTFRRRCPEGADEVDEGILLTSPQAPLLKGEGGYLLFIGRLEERKNVCGIIEAFEILKEKYNITHRLVLAGKPGYGYDRIMNYESRIKHWNEIIFKGFVNNEEKFELLKKADVFLFPSFYEGFGLPILEAQSLGCPVITSNASSMPELICSKVKLSDFLKFNFRKDCSALIVDPNNPEEIAEATYMLISDKNFKNDIIKKGFENVKRFSWEKCAKRVSKLIG